MNVVISRKVVMRLMLGTIFVLALLHIGQLVIYFLINDPDQFDFIELLDFDYEGNLPSWYSSFALLFAAILLAVISRYHYLKKERYRHHWFGLALIFLFLSLDEGAQIHEGIGDLVSNIVPAEGVFYFAWVIPYGIAAIVFLISYLKFLFSLPKLLRIQFVISGGLFLLGAIGLELIGAREAEAHGTATILYSFLYTVEELCEMLGVVLFVYALTGLINRRLGAFTLEFHVN